MNNLGPGKKEVHKLVVDAYNKNMAQVIAEYKVKMLYGGEYWGFVSIKKLNKR